MFSSILKVKFLETLLPVSLRICLFCYISTGTSFMPVILLEFILTSQYHHPSVAAKTFLGGIVGRLGMMDGFKMDMR